MTFYSLRHSWVICPFLRYLNGWYWNSKIVAVFWVDFKTYSTLIKTSPLLISTIGEGGWFQSDWEIYFTLMYCTYLLLQFYGYGSQYPIDIHLHVNEFIMTAVLQIYFKSTINRSTLSKIIHYIMRFILLIKLCLCIFFGNIPRIFAESNTVCRNVDTHCWSEVIQDIYTMVYNSCRTNFSEWWLYIPVLCIRCILQTKIEHTQER